MLQAFLMAQCQAEPINGLYTACHQLLQTQPVLSALFSPPYKTGKCLLPGGDHECWVSGDEEWSSGGQRYQDHQVNDMNHLHLHHLDPQEGGAGGAPWLPRIPRLPRLPGLPEPVQGGQGALLHC